MARCHVRHNVAKSGLGAVQNALVHIYEKGTTTPVADAWNAEVGGVAVTTVLTNAQGEVEFWVDTARQLDLKITDNSQQAFQSGNAAATLTWTAVTETVEAFPPPAEILRNRAVVAGVTLTAAFDGTFQSGGVAGLRLDRSGTGVPQSVVFSHVGDDKWSVSLDALSGDFVVGAELDIAAEPGIASDILRLSRRDDDGVNHAGGVGTAKGPKAVFSRGSGSPVNEPGDITIIGSQQFALHLRPYDIATAGMGGAWIKQYGNAQAAILLDQTQAGRRHLEIQMGNGVGFGLVTDPDNNNSQTFAIVDQATGLRRFNIRSDGAFYFSTFVGVGADPITTFAPATALHLKGNAVNSGSTSLRLENTGSGGQTWQVQAGIIGVTEGGFTIRDVTNNVRRLVITAAGTVRVGEGDIATNATDGFLRIPVCNGAPSGVPTAFGGDSGGALVFNRSDGKLHVYIQGVGWWGVQLAA